MPTLSRPLVILTTVTLLGPSVGPAFAADVSVSICSRGWSVRDLNPSDGITAAIKGVVGTWYEAAPAPTRPGGVPYSRYEVSGATFSKTPEAPPRSPARAPHRF